MKDIKIKFNAKEAEFLNREFSKYGIDFATQDIYDFDTMSDLYEDLCDLEVDEGCYEPFTENGKMAVSLVTRFCKECRALFN